MKTATITPVWNEAFLLPQFLAHYAPQVDRMILLDNESDDGCLEEATKWPNVEIRTYQSGGVYRDDLKHKAVEGGRHSLVGQVDLVLLVDVDEFILPKDFRPLRQALGSIKDEITWTHGWNMFKRPEEAPYDASVSLLKQRAAGVESSIYSKPIIVRPEAELTFLPGFHEIKEIPTPPIEKKRESPFLFLHYIGIDEDFYVERSVSRVRRMSKENIRNHWALHYIDADENTFRQRFREEAAKAVPVFTFEDRQTRLAPESVR